MTLARLSPTMPLDYKKKRIYSLWDLSPGIQLFDYMHSSKNLTIYFLMTVSVSLSRSQTLSRETEPGERSLASREYWNQSPTVSRSQTFTRFFRVRVRLRETKPSIGYLWAVVNSV